MHHTFGGFALFPFRTSKCKLISIQYRKCNSAFTDYNLVINKLLVTRGFDLVSDVS